ncbi:glutamate mutase subunit S [Micromonospora pallida]|uniref:Glutamate mutase subunit S n=1 Tax=Micromonospora pallida TaxID=145854 RepID=A0A1C6RS36_9ACTN|nr:methylaspartate mutase subunit S [Micromonospora pallida]SCL20024.1 glutamate mutase subunit S [Micromonospora pallida]
MDVPLRNVRVVIGSIGDDIHVVGITILGHALRNAGAEVIQLGIQTPPAEFVATAVAEDADVVMVSSSNGHAAIWCDTLRADLDAAGGEGVLLYVGGNLAVSAFTPWEGTEARFLDMGFDRAFGPATQPAEAIRVLAEDLRARDTDEFREASRA